MQAAQVAACGRQTPPANSGLDRFLAPESIAIIGASADATKIRGRLLTLLRKNEFPGRIYPVNPSLTEIDGLPCFADVGAIGAAIDLAIVAIPAARVPGALAACAASTVAW